MLPTERPGGSWGEHRVSAAPCQAPGCCWGLAPSWYCGSQTAGAGTLLPASLLARHELIKCTTGNILTADFKNSVGNVIMSLKAGFCLRHSKLRW